MALLKFQLVWAWLIIFSVDRIIIGINATSPSSLSEMEDLTISDTVTLKSCCFDEYYENTSERQVCNNESVVNLRWDLLKLYRVPNSNITGVLEVNTVGLDTNKVRANCENPVSLSIPAWEHPENFSSKGYFASFDPDGHLQYDKYVYSPDDFCVQRSTPQDITVIACSYASHCTKAVLVDDKPISTLSPAAPACIARCCNYGEVWDVSGPKFRCVNSGEFKWEPEIYSQLKSDESLAFEPSNVDRRKPWVISTHPKDLVRSSCKDVSFTFQSPHEQIHSDEDLRKRIGKRPFKVLQDGTVWMKIRKLEWIQLYPGEYCIDGFQHGEGNFSGASMDALLFECKVLQTKEDIKGEERQRAFSLGFGIILIFCLIFLVMTAVVYVLLWSKHNIHGWTVFCYIISLLITYLLLGTSHFASISLEREVEKHGSIVTFCGIIGILCHFSFLSTFSWSTVLNFDLWCTFRNLRPTSGKSSGRKKFVLYCLFALAVPSAIVTTGLVLDFKYRNDVYSDVITPEYGKSVCYVDPRKGRFVFVILPIAALLGINFLLFCNTAYSLYKVKKATQFASSNSTKDETGNQTFRLILKLLLINGTIWIAEIISWYIQTDYEEVGLVSFILDVVNVLQAVGIFFLFVFKNDILESLRRTYPCLEGPVNFAFKLKSCVGSYHSRDQGATNTTSRGSNSHDRTSKTIESSLPVTKF